MAHRILHCGKSLTNYYLVWKKGVAGFSGAKVTAGDCIYVCGGKRNIHYYESPYLLTGLVKCERCGFNFQGQS